MTTDVQPQANPAARFSDSTRDGRETLATSVTYTSNSAFRSIMQQIKDLSR